ncbi:MAG: hypothetical protein M0R03_23875 [Novosphingobium sp.]|nr:hypothetical protein [Novosphingobium sp.]
MKKEYKEVYDLINTLNYSPSYIRFKNGVYSLEVFSLDYSPLGKGVKFYFNAVGLEELKEEIKLRLEEANDTHPSLNEGRLF